MADTKQLLESKNLDDIIREVNIEKKSFTPDGENEPITYNKLVVVFENDDTIELKLTAVDRATIYFALKELGAQK